MRNKEAKGIFQIAISDRRWVRVELSSLNANLLSVLLLPSAVYEFIIFRSNTKTSLNVDLLKNQKHHKISEHSQFLAAYEYIF